MPPHSEPEDGAASTLLHAHAPAAATITVREREGGTQAARRGAAARGEEAVDRVDRYVILRELGRGGMGVVYAAYDTVLDRKVALKLLRDRVGGAEGHGRMLREARALARLSHPNVVGIYEVGEVGERVFLAMELVDGISLRAWLRAQPRGQAEILAAFLQAAEGPDLDGEFGPFLAGARGGPVEHAKWADIQEGGGAVASLTSRRAAHSGLVRAATRRRPRPALRRHPRGCRTRT